MDIVTYTLFVYMRTFMYMYMYMYIYMYMHIVSFARVKKRKLLYKLSSKLTAECCVCDSAVTAVG